jgi:hypothetical protein
MRRKRIRRKEIGEKMLGAGAGMVLLFGSGLDCPENSMILLYGGMAVGLALMYAGAHIADLWM